MRRERKLETIREREIKRVRKERLRFYRHEKDKHRHRNRLIENLDGVRKRKK